MNTYSYNGPVYKFDTCMTRHWQGQTTAVSEAKARSNLAHRWKTENGFPAGVKVTLPGKIERMYEAAT